ncbi:hypothetical protein A9Q81_16075 [Gammaproteobacteria bacterium 42_54_T18]|nr:hypothetical protein A9Q81_16075 [Gammaproteobacteria bacterium 42_54_T18]
MKNLLFVFDKPPHSSPATKEGLDAILTASAFGQNVTLLLLGDGIFQLLNNQDPSHLPAKNTASIFQALDMYGIENIVTPCENLKNKGLSLSDLSTPCDILDNTQLAKLYAIQDQILSF